jgi:hypothetical protein
MLEVDVQGRILFAAGAARGMTGSTDAKLTGMDVGEIFAPRDRGLVGSLRARAKPGQRFGPVLVNLNEDKTHFRKAMLSGVAMPDRDGRVYLTLAKGSIAQFTQSQQERSTSETALMDKETFAEAALEMMAASDSLGQKLGMTFVDLPESGSFKQKIGIERWQGFRENISTLLRSYAADGRTAAALDEGKFGLVHTKAITAETIQKELEALSREADPSKDGLDVAASEVDLDNDTLSERELAKAVMYTIQQFEKQGGAFNILSLEESFETFLEKNAQKISDFKSIINQQRFSLKFQTIVNLKSGDVAYY